MSSREKILKAVAENKPAVYPGLPEFSPVKGQDPLERFEDVIASSGARVIHCDEQSIVERVADLFPDGNRVSSVENIPGTEEISAIVEDRDFAAVNLFICRGAKGVGENGAIWVSEKECQRRAALFLSQHVVLILNKADIVETMHEVYQEITVDETGWGVFVAGPSKTADIEQSLVIGAHGPRSLTVFIV